MRRPPLAITANERATCSGLAVKAPWPMPTDSVRPGWNLSAVFSSSHWRVGTRPTDSAISMPVGAPKPKSRE